jgi:hypothetical protein
MARRLAASEDPGPPGAAPVSPATPGATRILGRLHAGTAEAAPGERAFGHLTATLPDGQEVATPCWVLHGRRPVARVDGRVARPPAAGTLRQDAVRR